MKYRKKPVVIEAIQFDGKNFMEVFEFSKGIHPFANAPLTKGPYGDCIQINTLEGSMRAYCGDWVIKGVKGEFYPCKPDIFEFTYDKVEPQDNQKESNSFGKEALKENTPPCIGNTGLGGKALKPDKGGE